MSRCHPPHSPGGCCGCSEHGSTKKLVHVTGDAKCAKPASDTLLPVIGGSLTPAPAPSRKSGDRTRTDACVNTRALPPVTQVDAAATEEASQWLNHFWEREDALERQSRPATATKRVATPPSKAVSEQTEVMPAHAQRPLPDGVDRCEILKIAQGRYAGYVLRELKCLVRHGRGRMVFSTGNRYDGDWRFNRREGFGIMQYTNGHVYRGGFRGNEFHGFGRLTFSEDEVYTGSFRGGRREGQGLYVWRDAQGRAVKYEGGWKANRFDGEGKLYREGQLVYEGLFREGLKHGYGREWTKHGHFFSGQYKNGKFDGENSTMILADGRIFRGTFRNGRPDGEGTIEYPDGRKTSGEFQPSSMRAKVPRPRHSGELHQMDENGLSTRSHCELFVDGVPHGRGRRVMASGRVEEGSWNFGKFQLGSVVQHEPTAASRRANGRFATSWL